jgi:DNA polymerase III epsilon subunit-like protein
MAKRKAKASEVLSKYLHSVQSRPCVMCKSTFTPPLHATAISTDDNHKTHCAKCRRIIRDATMSIDPPLEEGTITAGPGAPMRQVVFDLETWGLDRGWGVTMVASFLIHGGPEGTKRITISHRDSKAWKSGKRSEDRELAEEVFNILNTCHVAYAHNGERFDMRWLRTVALKYELQMPRLKLIDPCQIAWKRYRLGRNSLESLADFLQLEQKKLHIPPDVWRWALMDNDDNAWALIIERCKSDVELLNAVASRVTGDVGMVDFQGSYR